MQAGSSDGVISAEKAKECRYIRRVREAQDRRVAHPEQACTLGPANSLGFCERLLRHQMKSCSMSDVPVILTGVQSSQEVSVVNKDTTQNQKVYLESCVLYYFS